MTRSKVTSARAPKKSKDEKRFSLISDATLRNMYTAMLGCRALEERSARELRRRRTRAKQLDPIAGVLSSRPPIAGQEAMIVGTTLDLLAEDTIAAPSGEVVLRSPGRSKWSRGKAARAEQALAESRRNVIAFAASSGAQLTVGAGVALAYKDHGKQHGPHRVVVAFGDADADSVGAWNEALHLAGHYHLPILFVLRPGVGLLKATKAERTHAAIADSISERAKLAGVTTIPVDYTDVIAMYRVSFESLARARKGTGATLLVSTRFAIEEAGRLSVREDTDPIKRMEEYLTHKGLFSAKWKADILSELKKST